MLNRISILLVSALAVLGLLWAFLGSYSEKVCAKQVAVQAVRTLESLDIERKGVLAQDVRTAEKRAVLVAPAQAAVKAARAVLKKEVPHVVEDQTGRDSGAPDAWRGVFNDAIRAGNSSIESAKYLP